MVLILLCDKIRNLAGIAQQNRLDDCCCAKERMSHHHSSVLLWSALVPMFS